MCKVYSVVLYTREIYKYSLDEVSHTLIEKDPTMQTGFKKTKYGNLYFTAQMKICQGIFSYRTLPRRFKFRKTCIMPQLHAIIQLDEQIKTA